MSDAQRILILEDDADARDVVTALLEEEGYRVSSRQGFEAGLECIREHVFDLVVVIPASAASALADPARVVAAAEPTPVGLLAAADLDAAGSRPRSGIAFEVARTTPPSLLLQKIAAALGGALPATAAQRDVVVRYFQALEHRDWSALGDVVSADITYALEGTIDVVRGREAFLRYTADTFALFPEAKFRDLAVFRMPNGAAARYRGEWREPAGQVRTLVGAVVFEIAADRIRSVGVRLDLQVLEDSAAWSQRTSGSPRLGGFSTRQVAQLIGVGEASVKRLSDAGTIGCVRKPGRSVRRFAPAHVVDYLRRGSVRIGVTAEGGFAVAVREGDLEQCVACALQLFGRGTALDRILDDLVVPAASSGSTGLLIALTSRLSALSSAERKHHPAIVMPVGPRLAASLADCALRGRGFDVLTPVDGMGPTQVAELAVRSRAHAIVLAVGDRDATPDAARAANAIAADAPTAKVLLYQPQGEPRPDSGVRVVRSLLELGDLAENDSA